MFINTTIVTDAGSADVRIDSEQVIRQALVILIESGKIPNITIPDYFHSHLNSRPVSAYITFAEEGINDGDILTVIE